MHEINPGSQSRRDLLEIYQAAIEAVKGRHAVAERLRVSPLDGTVRLPSTPGRGGRNQHLALAAAQVLSGREGVWILSAGTDGPTDDAGALVDGGTIRRAEVEGLVVDQVLLAADAGSLVEATGDLITSGPTGTNVMDLIIELKR